MTSQRWLALPQRPLAVRGIGSTGSYVVGVSSSRKVGHHLVCVTTRATPSSSSTSQSCGQKRSFFGFAGTADAGAASGKEGPRTKTEGEEKREEDTKTEEEEHANEDDAKRERREQEREQGKSYKLEKGRK